VSFASGGGWSRRDDTEVSPVVVLSHEAADKLLGSSDIVGRSVLLGTRNFKIVGVLAPWLPTPQFWDVINNSMSRPQEFFVPFDTIRDPSIGLTRTGDSDGFGSYDRDDPQAFFTTSEIHWIQYWVEMDPSKRQAYQDFTDAYALEQKALGRFPRPLNNRVQPMMGRPQRSAGADLRRQWHGQGEDRRAPGCQLLSL
jgi:putative ABC transport system permease protein